VFRDLDFNDYLSLARADRDIIMYGLGKKWEIRRRELEEREKGT